MIKNCADCRDGEHDNYDDNVKLVYVKDPDNGKMVKRSYMCASHRDMYNDDGYIVKCIGNVSETPYDKEPGGNVCYNVEP
jgi:hypothetical protein